MWKWILRNLIRSEETNRFADEIERLKKERGAL
jgi:hypothetical protein